jgi:hypothetical protein
MTFLVCWLLFPLALAALGLGCGLLLEAASAVRLPTFLLPGAGLAVIVPTAGRYGIWIQGSFRRQLELAIDGRRVGSALDELSHGSQYVELGSAKLMSGAHEVRLTYGGDDLRPGSDGAPLPLGPLVLSTATADRPVESLPPAKAGTLLREEARLDRGSRPVGIRPVLAQK